MKIIYSELKKLIPNLDKSARQVADDLTMIGHFCDGFEKTEGEEVISLEVRQNRGDCLGYYGIAKELSTLYDIPLIIDKTILPKTNINYNLPIKATAISEIQRIMAVRVTGIKNKLSPDWLKKFLSFHDINPINTVVDLTNYIMIWYGIPNHAFDTAKIGKQLAWELNKGKHKYFTTLDGTKIKLEDDTFQVSSENGVASLAGIVGGKNSGIELDTKETLVEMAIYNRSKVRQDSRKLKVITEASIRLDKELDTELIPQAFSHLISLILENCGGEITSRIYDFYPKKPESKVIPFDFKKPSLYSGIKITEGFGKKVFKNLGCEFKATGIVPPTLRKDIGIEEDLIEEVVRFWGYHNIPSNKPIAYKKMTDITPKIVYLIENVRDILTRLGYDEIKSWPLIKKKDNRKNKQLSGVKPIYTENSINNDYTVLRMSIISSLINQEKQYKRYKLPQQKFFEIGKVYYQANDRYCEHYSLGVYDNDKNALKLALGALEKQLNVQINKKETFQTNSGVCAEIHLEKFLKQAKIKKEITPQRSGHESIKELTRQIITLDANVVLNKEENPKDLLKRYRQKLSKHLWQIAITDIYLDQKSNKYKYTFQASYFNIDDKTAKKIHLEAFNLKKQSC